MTAHRSYERFEQGHQATGGPDSGEHYARNAAMVVAVMAGFLAIASFFSNEAVKHVITEETHRANATAQLETNHVKINVAQGNAQILRVLGAETEADREAAEAAVRHDARITEHLRPIDNRLEDQIHDHEYETDHANEEHVEYELAAVGLEVGIVLATVSIIARRRWLLGLGGAFATAGVLLIFAGLVV